MDSWRRRGGNLIYLVLCHNLFHRDATSQFHPYCAKSPHLQHLDFQQLQLIIIIRMPASTPVSRLLDWAVVLVRDSFGTKKLILASFQNVHLGHHQNQWDLNKGDHLVVETHHRHLLDVVVHQGGLGRGRFHLRTWGQSSRLVSLKMMRSGR